jgi:hypothetical protein
LRIDPPGARTESCAGKIVSGGALQVKRLIRGAFDVARHGRESVTGL